MKKCRYAPIWSLARGLQYLTLGGVILCLALSVLPLGLKARNVLLGLTDTDALQRAPAAPTTDSDVRPGSSNGISVAEVAEYLRTHNFGPPWMYATIAAGLLLILMALRMLNRRQVDNRVIESQRTGDESDSGQTAAMRIFRKRQDVLRILLRDKESLLKNQLCVRHLMTAKPLVVAPTTPVKELRKLIDANRIHHLVVCDKDRRVVGVISDRDLRCTSRQLARHVMTAKPLTVAPDAPIGPAITFLIQEHISCLPVVDNGRLCGLLTTTDLAVSLQCTLQAWLYMANVTQAREDVEGRLDRIDQMLAQALADNSGVPADKARATTTVAQELAGVRAELQEQFERLANFDADSTTGLGGRHALGEVLDALAGVRDERGHSFCLALIALDQEDADSDALRTAVGLVSQAARDSDFVAHYEGSTVAVVLTETDLDGAAVFCERLQAAFVQASAGRTPITASIGLTAAAQGENGQTLLDRAESLLAQSHAHGGNRICTLATSAIAMPAVV